ncbi:hypothetical protein [Tissierella sp. Yu-01]|uniref:hypothetical protein n=1 Tax=Tissierella sp. Yu-01 TaxID=3035694 RepID=UPI00240E8246|nr:hypothetical protein [Tissierella sp. Yu-01]WFA09992.1 hypothetical protein P3962_05415 [Tissierella sp. Yu-01]
MSDFDSVEEDAVQEVVDVEVELEDKVTLIGEFIRDNSMSGNLTKAEDFIDEPFSLEVDEVLPLLEELKGREEFSDIIMKKGAETIYLFSVNYITLNYAKLMILVEEKDFFKMIAETVREESRIYPRPTDIKLFSKAPFKLSRDEFIQVYDELKKKEEYMDIKETRASNQALYLYSDKYMKNAYARSLAEWVEVEAEQNP